MALEEKRGIFAGLPSAMPRPANATFIILLLLLMPIASAIPQNIPLHGRITSAAGVPVSSVVGMQFKIYNVSSGGTALYDTGTIFIQPDAAGLYNYTLSSINLPFDEQYYLEVTTNGETGGRISLGSVGYAYRSNISDSLNPANSYAASNITLSQLLFNPGALLSSLQNGALEFDGSGLYFTASGNRSKIVILPDIAAYLAGYYTKNESDSITAGLNSSISQNSLDIALLYGANITSNARIDSLNSSIGTINSTLDSSKGNLQGGNTWLGTQEFYGPVYMQNDTYMITVAAHEVNGSLVIQDLARNTLISLDAGSATVGYFKGDVNVTGELYVGSKQASLYLYNQTAEALTLVAASYYNKTEGDTLYRKVSDMVSWSSITGAPVYNNLSGSDIVSLVGNWSADKSSYTPTANLPVYNNGTLGAAENATINALVTSNTTINDQISSVNSTAAGKAGVGACAANQWAIATTTGAPTCAQVDYANLSGSVAVPYQSSAAGWTNASADLTSSTMNVSVAKGIIIATTTAKPACAIAERGHFWVDQGGAGVADLLWVCMKNSTDSYNWVQISIG